MKTLEHAWLEEFPASIIVCDPQGIILEMNGTAAQSHEKDGGRALIGTNLLNCHPEPARSKVEHLLAERKANVYTIEKNGQKKIVYQTPWYENGEYAGIVELVFEIPFEMPHFIRG
jgi:transcriptional regulator with PAS, ATPase and Fis domain